MATPDTFGRLTHCVTRPIFLACPPLVFAQLRVQLLLQLAYISGRTVVGLLRTRR